jgi:hypothetical protein
MIPELHGLYYINHEIMNLILYFACVYIKDIRNLSQVI